MSKIVPPLPEKPFPILISTVGLVDPDTGHLVILRKPRADVIPPRKPGALILFCLGDEEMTPPDHARLQ